MDDPTKLLDKVLKESRSLNFSGFPRTFEVKPGKIGNFLKRNESIQIRMITLLMRNSAIYGFVYCRSSPNHSEIQALKLHFRDYDVIMGDLNLSHKNPDDIKKRTSSL